MARFRIILIAVLAIAAFASCNRKEVKVSSQGGPYEILVVTTTERWEGVMGDTLREVLGEYIEVLNNPEPKYSLAQINPRSFAGFLAQHRNILIVSIGDRYPEPSMMAEYDLYSKPQLIVRVSGPDEATLTQYISTHRNELQAIYEIAERDRSLALNKRSANVTLNKQIKDKFGFDIDIPKDYIVRNSLDNFMWISKEYPLSSQGIIVYNYPYTNRNNFTTDSLVATRDRFVGLIPGENPGSHMITYPEYIPAIRHLRIHGRYWAEMRGFWDVKNDFMGGPFVSYSTLDTETNRVVAIDCYVYSPDPNKPKRNMLRQLEHIIYSVSFPGDEAIRNSASTSEE